MAHPENGTVAVLVATADRPALLERRALPSIASQSLLPSRVVVVDDSGSEEIAARSGQAVRDWQPAGVAVDFLRNRRTKGASGAWNSGLDHLLRTCRDPRRVRVAILDDDDRWDPLHLESCLAAVEEHGLDMVAAPFRRIGEAAGPRLVAPPPSLDIADFMIGNPGIQGSNLVVRLSALLEAGMFDESLPSCTDRDLCIRLAELPGLRYGATPEPTVHHFACSSRERLSTPGSFAKTEGLDRFFRKYRGRMSETQRAAFRARAARYFGWTEAAPGTAAADDPGHWDPPASPPRPPAPPAAPPHLIVGVIADTARLDRVANLLSDLRELAGEPGLSGHDVLILENGAGRTSDRALRELAERERSDGLRVHLVDRARHVEDAANGLVPDGGAGGGRRLPIAPARTVLQSYLYAFASNRPGSIVWIVDDDMRLDPLVIGKDGRLRRRSRRLAPVLRELRRLHAAGGVDIAIGAYTGAPPLPFAATVRVQIVDLAASLQWLAVLDPRSALPDRAPENAMLRSRRHDYYYDLSRKQTDRLETPFWITPGFPGETVGEAFTRMARQAERILAGEQVFRPLAVGEDTDPLSPVGGGLQRGGNTFVLDVEALRLAPNPSPAIDGRPSRRSDMIWALLQERYFGRRVASLPIALYHDRAGLPAGGLDVERIVDDIRGYAAFRALQDTPDMFRAADDLGLEAVEGMLDRFTDRARKFLDERVAAFRLSFHRIRGLSRVLHRLVEDDRRWWREDEYRSALDRLRAFSERLAEVYTMETLHRVEREAGALTDRQIREYLDELPSEVENHRIRLEDSAALLRGLADERVANARAIARDLTAPGGPLALLGCGAEGVALSDGERVFKVFDYLKSSHAFDAPAFLRSLVGAWRDTRCLYPVLDFHESGYRAVLVYPFEPSEPYIGGHGPGMVDLLAECRRHGVVCRNIHPDNLRVVDGRVRLIDYGSDIRPLEDERDFDAMCRRAWLSCRWANRPDLKDIMRRALNDAWIPELEGYDGFREAVRRVTGRNEASEDIVLGMIGKTGSVLDYGCGKGRIAREMAKRGMRVLGYDPDRAHRRRWESLCREAGNLRFTHERVETLAAGPFDLVVCRRVLCTIEDDAELRTVLADLRASVTEDGRVVVTACDPHFTFGGPSPEVDRQLPPGARYEDTFAWRKRIRATGRVRQDVHRPERALRREFARAGLAVCRRVEEPSVNLERFEPMSEHLTFELRPLAPLPGEVTLLIKACAMEAATLDVQVRHLVSQLEGPRAFAERVLAIDSREDGFLRQHARGSLSGLRREARRLKDVGWIDRIVEGPGDGEAAAALNRRWFGIPSERAHAATGAQVSSTLAGFEACETRYVLHVDADVMIARMDRGHDYMAEMLAVLAGEPGALTVALNIAMDRERPWTDRGPRGAWRTEARAGMIDLARLRDARPLPNRTDGDRLALPWHRALDRAIEAGAGRSFRGGDRRTFHVHPPNARKNDLDAWFAALDRIEHGAVPRVQTGRPDWTGGIAEWMGPPRREPFVFVVSGRNVPPGRFRRCLESMTRQKGPRWGAVIVDDASDPMFAEHFETACAALGERCTVLRNRRRRGLLANMVTAIRTICADPETVIVTLDADDALIGERVLERLAAEYRRGADVTAGSMLRTDKAVDYPVCFERPRERRGGNVWQHLRSFRKRLFDAIPDEALRLDGDYVDLASDWAFMLPIVEMAEHPVHIPEPLYLYEPSGVGKGAGRAAREEAIGRIVGKEPVDLDKVRAANRRDGARAPSPAPCARRPGAAHSPSPGRAGHRYGVS
ncbi:MAG: glycosyltransferase [Defluviicoccus sp.]|nr:glycosyltransferase [Defluviicoccus sp.]MDE0279104.1 glycosyltransferase [Defluviicoccus sp.]